VQRHDVAFAQQRVELDPLGLAPRRIVGGNLRIVRHHSHVER
jgi:hypothetical protein